MNKESMKINKVGLFVIISVVITVIIILVVLSNPPIKDKYVHLEQKVINDTGLPRHECINLRIRTSDMGSINISSLLELELEVVGVYDSYAELPECNLTDRELYYTEFSLDSFCIKDCDVEGVLCATYAVEYYDISEINLKNYYEDLMFTEKLNTSKQQEKLLLDCEVR